MSEQDLPPPSNTFRRVVWATVAGLAILRGYYGRRLVGGAIGLMLDCLAEGATQAFYARLPGHPEQAQDSLGQVGRDRELYRFRGESNANYAARVAAAWDDYPQAGTKIQMLRVIDQWGTAGWPLTWINNTVTLVETSGVGVFKFTVTIPFGLFSPAWTPATFGDGSTIGEDSLYFGIGPRTDMGMLMHLIRKWKPARSKATLVIYYTLTDFVTIPVY